MVGKFPSCVLNLSLPFEAIDVNVHPSKIEVRFINERPVFDAVYHAAKSALLKHDDRKQAHFKDDSALHEIRRSSTFNNAQAVFRKPGPPKVQPQIKPKDEFNPFSDIEFSKPNPKPKLQAVA